MINIDTEECAYVNSPLVLALEREKKKRERDPKVRGKKAKSRTIKEIVY